MDAVKKMLDKARDCRSLNSDAALAALIGVSRQSIHRWREGVAYPTDEHVMALAKLCHEDPAAWLLAMKAETTAGPAGKVWADLAKRLAAAAACVLVVAGISIPQHARADDAGSYAQRDALYIMRNWWGFIRRAFSTKRPEFCASC